MTEIPSLFHFATLLTASTTVICLHIGTCSLLPWLLTIHLRQSMSLDSSSCLSTPSTIGFFICFEHRCPSEFSKIVGLSCLPFSLVVLRARPSVNVKLTPLIIFEQLQRAPITPIATTCHVMSEGSAKAWLRGYEGEMGKT